MTEVIHEPRPDEAMNPFEVFLGVIARPAKTFAAFRTIEKAHVWLILVFAILSLIIASLASAGVLAEEAQVQMDEQREALAENMSEEDLAEFDSTLEAFQSPAFFAITAIGSGIITLAITFALRAGILHLLSTLFGGQIEFNQSWRMAAWSWLPIGVKQIIVGIATGISGSIPAQGLNGIFTSAELEEISLVLQALLGSVDIWAVWSVVLLAIAVTATAKLSRGKGIAIALIYWVLGVLFAVGGVAVGVAIQNALGFG